MNNPLGYEGYEALPAHCASGQCNWCRTHRERAMERIRKAQEPPQGSAWDRPLYGGRDPRDVLSYWANSDAPARVTTWTMKAAGSRTKGHRLVRGAR